MNRLTKLKETFFSLSKAEQNLIWFICSFILTLYPVGKLVALIQGEIFTAGFFRCIYLTLSTQIGIATNTVVSVGLLLVLFMLSQKNEDLNAVKAVDERGVAISTVGTYGTAEWMDRETAEKVYEVASIENANGTVLGQFSDNGEEVIALPYKKQANRNLILIGPPGSGKSVGYVRTAMLQSIKRGESIVVTDPKGELLMDMRKFLLTRDYDVKIFNLVNLDKSDAWDCIREIYNPKTGDIDDQRAVTFCEIVMSNTGGGGGGDAFWETGEKNLLKVVVLYKAYQRQQAIKIELRRVISNALKNVQLDSEDECIIHNILDDEESTTNELITTYKQLASLTRSSDDISQTITSIMEKAPKCTISEIYHDLVNVPLSDWSERFNDMPVGNPATIAWSIFNQASDNVKPGFQSGLSQRLQLFQMKNVRRILCNDDIRLDDIGSRKTALFLVISDDNASMQMLSSLMFSFLLKDLKEAYDASGGKGRIPVNIIADEAANTGRWPEFEKTIATARSREIAISLILQSLPQLSTLYGDEIAETIIGCCNTILVLGCNDATTAKYISDLSGTATIRAKSIKDNRNDSVNGRALLQGYSISEGDGKRNLLNPDEVRALGEQEILIYSLGKQMLRAKRFGFFLHPYTTSPEFLKTTWSEIENTRQKYQATENTDAFTLAEMKRNQNL